MRDCICVTGLLVLLWECISHLVKHEHVGVRPRSVVYVLSAHQNDKFGHQFLCPPETIIM